MVRLQLRGVMVHERSPLLRVGWVRWSCMIAVALLVLAWILALATPRPADSAEVVVHFTTTFGIDALGPWSTLLRIPMLGTALLVINGFLARTMAPSASGDESTPIPGDVAGVAGLPAAVRALIIATVLLEAVTALAAFLLYRINAP